MWPLAKLWTWIGQVFIPVAVGWTVYIRGGLTEQPALGVIVSRAYWGLLVTLITATALSWICALYVRAARKRGLSIVVPPNTTFEEESARNRVVSIGTTIIYVSAVLLALAIFAVRYSESEIHKWDDQRSLQGDFWASRAIAHAAGCKHQPCFAVGQRVTVTNKPIFGVNEYILYFTDGVLLLFILGLIAGLGFLARDLFHRRTPFSF